MSSDVLSRWWPEAMATFSENGLLSLRGWEEREDGREVRSERRA